MHTKSRKKLFSALALALGGLGMFASTQAAEGINTDRLEARIQTTHELSPYLRAHDIGVRVDKAGEATLSGFVNEDIDKELAGQIALGVDGIKEVQNDIEVKADYEPARDRKDSSFGDKVDDFSITARVKSKLQ